MLPNLLLILALVALSISFVYSARYVLRRDETRTGIALIYNLAGLILLIADFVYSSVSRREVALTAFGDSIVFFALMLLLVNNVAMRIARSHVISVLVMPLVLLLCVMGLFFESWFPTRESRQVLGQGFLTLHIVLFLLSYALFALSAAFGAMFLALDGNLKAKSFPPFFFKLPGLARLDSFAGRSAMAGLALLTLAIALSIGNLVRVTPTGAGAASNAGVSDFKVLSTYVIWAYYSVYTFCRMQFGWVGRRSCLIMIGGLALVLILYIGGLVVPTGTLHGPGATSALTLGARRAAYGDDK